MLKYQKANIIKSQGEEPMDQNQIKDTLTKNYIFQAFFELLTKQHYDDINVSSVCQKAGVSRMSFYRNFKSKEDLFETSLERILLNLKNSLSSQKPLNQYVVTREIFATALKYKEVSKSFKNTKHIDMFVDKIAEKLFTFAPDDKINPTMKYIPIFYFSALIGVLGMWMNNGAVETPEEMAKGMCSISDFPIFTEHNINLDENDI